MFLGLFFTLFLKRLGKNPIENSPAVFNCKVTSQSKFTMNLNEDRKDKEYIKQQRLSALTTLMLVKIRIFTISSICVSPKISDDFVDFFHFQFMVLHDGTKLKTKQYR